MTTARQPAHPALTRRGAGVTADGEFYMPTRVFFGRGVAGQAGQRAAALGGTRIMLVSDPGVAAAGLLDPIRDALAGSGLDPLTFTQVEPNPRDADCLAGAEQARDARAQAFVAVGGGSPIDTAKCIALLLTNGGHPRDWEDFGTLRTAPLPVLAIPTTAGTGSEVSPSAVITDTERKKKMSLFDLRNCPRIALVDPELTLSCPPSLTAAAGMDALSHAVDSLHCRLATPASDALALEGARLVARYIQHAFAGPSDIEARCGMAQGSLTAGLAVGLTDVAGAHCLAEAIGGLYGHPHGYCCVAGTSHPTHVIGHGTAASCTSKAVVAAVAAGGVITFSCGPRPVTITMRATAKVRNTSSRVVLDGGGKVTLSGGGVRRILYMDTCDPKQVWTTSHCQNQARPKLTVQNLTFKDGNSTARHYDGGGGGAIFDRGGQLKVVNSRYVGNRCDPTGPDLGGAAIRALSQYRNRPVYVVHSTFRGGVCSNGGALSSIGVSWVVLNSVMIHNRAIGRGANPARHGTPGGGSGGAIYNDGDRYTLTVAGTVISFNHAREGGGAIFFVSNDRTGTLRIKNSRLHHNPNAGFHTAGYPGIFFLGHGHPIVIHSTIN